MNDKAEKLVRAAVDAGCEPIAYHRPWAGVRTIVARLPQGKEPLLARQSLLGWAERHRAARFRFDADRANFIARRVLLRLWLAAELGTAPGEVRLDCTAEGKPFLALGRHRAEIVDFSISQSGEHLALALSRVHRIGIDIEQIRDLPDIASMLETIATRAEAAALADLPEANRKQAFFQLWTAKEACLKALGKGFLLDPRRISFNIDTKTIPVWIGPGPQSGYQTCADVFPGGLCSFAAIYSPASPNECPVIRRIPV